MTKIKKIAIIGGGASGMTASIIASKAGYKVELFEKSSKLGRKILATGNGRCNISNRTITIENYHGKYPSFVKDTLKRYRTKDIAKFFSSLGLELTEGTNGRLYPMSLQASSVVDILSFELQRLGVVIHLNSEVSNIESLNSSFKVDGTIFDIVVIATGSQAMPTLGSSDSGYKFARALGHHIEKPFASLVQLVCDDILVHNCSGVKIEAEIEVLVDKRAKMRLLGDLLFTNYGLSGSAILDVSRTVGFALSKDREVTLTIDLLPKLSQDELKSLLLKRAKLPLENRLWLNGIIHKKLIDLIFAKASLSKDCKRDSKTINKLSYMIKNLPISIKSSRGVKHCEVMAGGVSTKDINPKTMESNLVKGLYFCGEVLDIDGDCGGYNLHFAWASGSVVGESLAS